MQTTKSIAPPKGIGLGLFLLGIVVAGMLVVAGFSDYETWSAPLLAAVLIGISVPILNRQAVRENDPLLFRLLLLALVLKLVGGVIRHYVAFDVYGISDAGAYYDVGLKLSTAFHHGQFHTGLPSFTDTNFITLLSGIVLAVIGPTRLGAFLVFSWLGFWGLFLFYRAFVLAVPDGRRRSYARLVFFLPSLLFWPSSIGKDAWMVLALGIAAYGAAKVLTRGTWRSVPTLVLGLWLATIVRPHVAGMFALALALGYVMRPGRADLRQLAMLAKLASLTLLVVIAAVLLVRTDQYLRHSNLAVDEGVNAVLTDVTERTAQGGSLFAPSVLQSPGSAPVAAFTVLFRPLFLEANSPTTLLASLESTFLLFFTISRLRWLRTALGSVRRQPYVAFVIAYAAAFVIGFSAIANFGILVRERVQLLPFYLILLAIPPREIERSDLGLGHGSGRGAFGQWGRGRGT